MGRPMRVSALAVVCSTLLSGVLTGCSGGEPEKKVIASLPKKPVETSELIEFDPAAPADVTVNLATPAAPKPVNGLLAGMSAEKPAADFVTPLAPIQVRGWQSTVPVDRVKALPARWILLLSDTWGYPSENYPNGAGKAPFEDEVGWDTKVGEQIRATKGRADVLYEPWSAPDIPDFFNGTEEQFHRVWLLAYAAVRRELGSAALMVGPSISSYDPDRITRFLEFCLARGCQVDVLSWQELVSSPADITQITAHLQDARTRFVQNPRYARLGIKEINITEYGSSADQYRPGETVAYVSALEGGQADGAGRSCFSAPSGDSNCYNNTLDGLLGPSSGKPNGVWYVMAAYAATLAGRVASTTTPGISAFAGKPNPASKAIQVVVGNHRTAAGPAEEKSPIVDISGLPSVPEFAAATELNVEVRIVSATTDGELGESRFLTAKAKVNAGVLRIKVPELPAGAAAIINVPVAG